MTGRQGEAPQKPKQTSASLSALRCAYEAFNRGDLGACEAGCRAILRDQPEQPEALLLLGNSLGRQGRAKEALGHLETVARLMPENPEAHYAIGMALSELRRWKDAEAAFRRSLAYAPGHAYAYNNLGVVLREAGALALAIACFREAYVLDPDFRDAQANLARSLLEGRRPTEALPHFDALGDLAATQPTLGVLHSQALRQAGRSEEAVTLLTRITERDPGNAGLISMLGQAQREAGLLEDAVETLSGAAAEGTLKAKFETSAATALLEQGRFGEAMAAFRRALGADPDQVEAWLGLTEIKDFTPNRQDIEAMERCAQNPNLSEEQRAQILFALARSLDRTQDYDRAFAVYEAANAVRRKREQSEIHLAIATHGAMRQRFQAIAEPQGGEVVRDDGPVPIFIVGMPRSGTTLIEQILASHPEVHGAGEIKLLYKAIVEMQPQGPEGLKDLDRAGMRAIAARYLGGLADLAKGARYATDKMPSNYERLGVIAEALPHAPIVHLLRDPLDTCISCYTTLFTEGQWFSYDLEDLARYYRLYEEMMAHWRSVLPAGRMLEVVYEDLVAEPEEQVRRLLDHCGLDWSDDCLQFHENQRPVLTASASQVRHPLYSSSIGRWRRYEKQLRPLIDALSE